MTPSEKSKQEQDWILSELKRQNKKTTGSEWVYEFHESGAADVPEKLNQKLLLKELSSKGLIRKLKFIGGIEPLAATLDVDRLSFENAITELSEASRPAFRIGDKKPLIYISVERGIWRADWSGLYRLRGVKRMQIVQRIGRSKGVRSKTIQKMTGYSKQDVSNEIARINKLFRKNLALPSDLIISGATGYQFNTEELQITLRPSKKP